MCRATRALPCCDERAGRAASSCNRHTPTALPPAARTFPLGRARRGASIRDTRTGLARFAGRRWRRVHSTAPTWPTVPPPSRRRRPCRRRRRRSRTSLDARRGRVVRRGSRCLARHTSTWPLPSADTTSEPTSRRDGTPSPRHPPRPLPASPPRRRVIPSDSPV